MLFSYVKWILLGNGEHCLVLPNYAHHVAQPGIGEVNGPPYLCYELGICILCWKYAQNQVIKENLKYCKVLELDGILIFGQLWVLECNGIHPPNTIKMY